MRKKAISLAPIARFYDRMNGSAGTGPRRAGARAAKKGARTANIPLNPLCFFCVLWYDKKYNIGAESEKG